MKVICAWCQTELAPKAGPDNAISHGICVACDKVLREQLPSVQPARVGSEDVPAHATGQEVPQFVELPTSTFI